MSPEDSVRERFFDGYRRFYGTSETAPFRDRLNLRYEAIFAANRDVFDGARVLDLASHDGRWSFAALKTGAAHVVGIEGRPELVANAERTFGHYGIDGDRYRFIAGDIFDAMADVDSQFDVVLCLGFLYHTLRYNELMYQIRKLEPRHLIVDTGVIRHRDPLVQIRVEHVALQSNAIADRYSWGDGVLSGEPSIAALRELLLAYGFEIEHMSDWNRMLRAHPGAKGLDDYTNGRRVTALARATNSGGARPVPPAKARRPAAPAPANQPSVRQKMRRIAKDFTPPAVARWITAHRR
jgi:predicted nicotinamide N-methyase